MKRCFKIATVLCALFCSAAHSEDKPATPAAVPAQASESKPADEAGKARIRFFGQNAVGVKYFPGKTCIPPSFMGFGDGAVVVSGTLGDAFSSFVGASSNTSIGMPATPNSINVSQRDGMMSKAYYKEYTVKAGEPMTIWLSFADVPHAPGKGVWMRGAQCKIAAATLVPENGKDYEVSMDIRSDNDCTASINEIRATDKGIVLVPAPVKPASDCQ